MPRNNTRQKTFVKQVLTINKATSLNRNLIPRNGNLQRLPNRECYWKIHLTES